MTQLCTRTARGESRRDGTGSIQKYAGQDLSSTKLSLWSEQFCEHCSRKMISPPMALSSRIHYAEMQNLREPGKFRIFNSCRCSSIESVWNCCVRGCTTDETAGNYSLFRTTPVFWDREAQEQSRQAFTANSGQRFVLQAVTGNMQQKVFSRQTGQFVQWP